MRISDWSSDVCSSDLRQFSDLDAVAQHRRLPLGKVKKARRRLTLADQNFAALRRNPVSLVDQVARRRRPQSREMLAAQRLFLGRKTHLRPAQPQARQYAKPEERRGGKEGVRTG